MNSYLKFSRFLVEVEVGRNHIMSGETHVFGIEVREVNRFFPFFYPTINTHFSLTESSITII